LYEQLHVHGWLAAVTLPSITSSKPIRRAGKTLKFLGVLLFVWSFSFYLRSFPTQPDIAAGRVYEFGSHGSVGFLTRGEWLAHNLLFASSLVCGLAGFLLDLSSGVFSNGFSNNRSHGAP
jgi:hypothetical protein